MRRVIHGLEVEACFFARLFKMLPRQWRLWISPRPGLHRMAVRPRFSPAFLLLIDLALNASLRPDCFLCTFPESCEVWHSRAAELHHGILQKLSANQRLG